MENYQEFLNMGYDEEHAWSLYQMQDWLFVGAKVGLILDHHTDELLNTELDEFIVSDIDWKQGKVRFNHSDGWAHFGEVVEL